MLAILRLKNIICLTPMNSLAHIEHEDDNLTITRRWVGEIKPVKL